MAMLLKLSTLVFLLLSVTPMLTLTSGHEEAVQLGVQLQQWKKPVLGSKPPQCEHKCNSCNPCVAAPVTPPNHKLETEEGDESYYLLSWKCRCGDKYYKP